MLPVNCEFTATVSNANNGQVTWTAITSPSNLPGTISASGLFTAPSFDEPETFTVTATSEQDPTQSASATLTLMPVIVTPALAFVYGGYTQQFTANIPVVWSLGQGGIGTIDQTGLYIAPLNPTNGGTSFQVIAIAQADPNSSAVVQVDPLAPNIQPVSPAAATLIGGQSQTFNVCWPTSATNWGCQNSGQTVASWSISPAGAGAISPSGVYTAPENIQTQQTVIVTATDIGNSALTSTATITLIPPAINVSPQTATLYGGQTEQLLAAITSVPIGVSHDVTWSMSPSGSGTLSASGLYTAPPVVTSPQVITITATSQSIPGLSSSGTLTLSPTQCAARAYGYVRSIVIDHTKVQNADQANFPFYFAVTDPLLASTANSGHMASVNG